MTAALVIAGGFAAWALVHSVLASRWMKSLVHQALGVGTARWYRLFFVVFAAISMVPVLAAVLLLPDRTLYVVSSPWRWLMVLVQVGALLALAVSLFQAGLMHFLGLAQLRARDPNRTGELQVRGFYRYVRHPLYLFSVVMLWFTPTLTRNFAVLYACMTAYFILGSYHEEALLMDEFRVVYARYRKQVARFVPWPGRSYSRGG